MKSLAKVSTPKKLDMFNMSLDYMSNYNVSQKNFVDFILAYCEHELLTSTEDSIATISRVTNAAKGSISVTARSIGMTVVKICSTFIQVYNRSKKSTLPFHFVDIHYYKLQAKIGCTFIYVYSNERLGKIITLCS